jgi:NADH:ubiquinone oxidoreductase subunit 5 (subunit L)/multisubunit Na+/H+ antiporter MnhA subunit
VVGGACAPTVTLRAMLAGTLCSGRASQAGQAVTEICLCFIRFVFLFLLRWFCCFLGANFIINGLVYFVDWNIVTVNGRSVIMTFLFDWIYLLFMGFDFTISSLVILYRDDYMFGDLNIVRFIMPSTTNLEEKESWTPQGTMTTRRC